MRTRCAASVIVAIMIGVAGLSVYGQPAQRNQPQQRANAPGATKEQFERWMTELSNWGRWGRDDQLGAANLITVAKRKQALSLVTAAATVSLGHDLVDDQGSDPANPFAIN